MRLSVPRSLLRAVSQQALALAIPLLHMLSIVQNVCRRLENTCQLLVFPESVGTVKGPTELI
jgi:hypothetical protein